MGRGHLNGQATSLGISSRSHFSASAGGLRVLCHVFDLVSHVLVDKFDRLHRFCTGDRHEALLVRTRRRIDVVRLERVGCIDSDLSLEAANQLAGQYLTAESYSHGAVRITL